MSGRGSPPPELLLGRPEFSGDVQDAARWTRGRRVLVTGAAGSIGSPLARALLAAEPERLILLDHHEYSLFSLERGLAPASDSVAYELADVRDAHAIERVFDRHAPQVVVHLAAAKHVPYGQRFPEGAVGTNVLATEHLLALADAAGVERFVYPSSDKSVDPPSLYGATKRIAEALLQSRAASAGWAVVRYVNIIGTRGSVIETFTQQILAERPLSVTDERMTRYWISMNEALWCILLAAEHGSPGAVLMPECGQPVPLMDTARQLSAWYRPEQPDYPIQCVGIRPGERLHEVLLSSNESFASGPAAGLRTVLSARKGSALQDLDGLMEELDVLQGEQLVARCLAAAEALQ